MSAQRLHTQRSWFLLRAVASCYSKNVRGIVSWSALALLALASGACAKPDVGRPCPQLLGDQDPTAGSGSRTQTQEVVGQSAKYPCDELICVASQGRSGYCSKKCEDDAGCPNGFTCRVIQTLGPFAGEKFCAWKQCTTPTDCGSKNDFCCTSVQGSNPVEELKLCEFSNNGKCGG